MSDNPRNLEETAKWLRGKADEIEDHYFLDAIKLCKAADLLDPETTDLVDQDAPPKWQPWVEFHTDAETLPIVEPPCRHCKHWRPIQTRDRNGRATGVRCCQAETMHHDFSCYVKRDT